MHIIDEPTPQPLPIEPPPRRSLLIPRSKPMFSWRNLFAAMFFGIAIGAPLGAYLNRPLETTPTYEYKYDQAVYDSVATVLDQLEQQKNPDPK